MKKYRDGILYFLLHTCDQDDVANANANDANLYKCIHRFRVHAFHNKVAKRATKIIYRFPVNFDSELVEVNAMFWKKLCFLEKKKLKYAESFRFKSKILLK